MSDFTRAPGGKLFMPAAEQLPEWVRPDPLRGRVVDRLTLIGRRHARHARDQSRTNHPIGPHVLAFFYSDPGLEAAELRTATRMFLDGPEVADLTAILGCLHKLALDYQRTDGFDPRVQMADRTESMSPAAQYLGLGASTLHHDTEPDRSGEHRTDTMSSLDPPTRGLAVLIDGTRLLLRHQGRLQPSPTIQSTHTLDLNYLPTRSWQRVAADFQDADPEVEQIHQALMALHEVTAQAADEQFSKGRSRRGRRRQQGHT